MNDKKKNSWIDRLIEKKLKENPSEYGYSNSFKTQKTKLSNLLQEPADKRANL